MKIRAAIALAALLAAAPQTRAQDLRTLAREAMDAVVVIRVLDAFGRETAAGSGFFVAPDHIVSNHHVVAGAERVEAVLADGSPVEVLGVLASDEINDLVVLRTASQHHAPLPISESGSPDVGEPIAVIGSPAGLAGTLAEGVVSALRPDGIGDYGRPGTHRAPMFQISAPISPGSSGSPVLNLQGEVVGVAVGQLLHGQNLNFAVPVEPLRRIVRVAATAELERFHPPPAGTSTARYVRNLVISLVFFGAIFFALRRLRG